jgi:hypothetical protein
VIRKRIEEANGRIKTIAPFRGLTTFGPKNASDSALARACAAKLYAMKIS